ncbi:MAG TPA: hypothetical protein VKW78_07575 [Terriglobales bacterium]|nr:hypothetical protein [Terriglobales bacterium]
MKLGALVAMGLLLWLMSDRRKKREGRQLQIDGTVVHRSPALRRFYVVPDNELLGFVSGTEYRKIPVMWSGSLPNVFSKVHVEGYLSMSNILAARVVTHMT